MPIKATLHPFLNGGVELKLDVEGINVGECLDSVMKQHPTIEKQMFEKKGMLKRHVEVLVNGKSTTPQELAYPVKDGDTLAVLVFLSGG
jgi:molybdopterin converting factor small subunit